jgi:hypothetical protein
MSEETQQQMESALGRVWALPIEEMEINIARRTISLELVHPQETVPEAAWDRHTLRFEHVVSFLYMADTSERRRELDPPEHLQLVEIYYRDAVEHTTRVPLPRGDTKTEKTASNFILEVDELAVLYIESSVVVVDGQRFEIGYPTA